MDVRLLLFLTISILLQGKLNAQEQCYSHIQHKKLLQNDPLYQERIVDHEKRIQKRLLLNNVKAADDTLLIPVVVHVVHTGEAEGVGTNISDAQIQSAINHLNDAYGNVGGTGVETLIRFALAKRDPDCNLTDGIIRVNGSGVANYSTEGIDANDSDGKGADEVTIKALSKWPNSDYYNIWIVNEIDDNDGGAGTQGYAYYPGASSARDGAIILYNAFGYDPDGTIGYNLKAYTRHNSTTVHELGHGFNLYHTFQGDDGNDDGVADQCPTDAVCGESGDCVDDTRRHQRNTSCTDGANGCDAGTLEDVIHNYMNYTPQSCKTEFTEGQKDRMRAAIETLRAGLVNSLATVAPDGLSPTAATCTPSTVNTSNGFGMGIKNVSLNTLNVASQGTVSDGDVNDRTCLHYTILEKNTSYDIEVQTGNANNEDVKVWIDYNNDGDFEDEGEEIFSSENAQTHSGSFQTPSNPSVEDTYLRMRVVSDWFNNTISGPCYNPTYGETEEYSILFQSEESPPSNVPSTKIRASQCNTTLDNFGEYLYCDGVSGASQYRWKIEHAVSGFSQEYLRPYPARDFTLNWIPGVEYNKTYSISVKAKVGEEWGDYGTVCSITTPATISTTKVRDAECNTTLTSMDDWLFCDAVNGAQQYMWKVEHAGSGYSAEYLRPYPVRDFNLRYLSGIEYGKTYTVQVKAKVGDVWGEYGVTCNIALPGTMPTTKIRDIDCDIALSSINQWVYCDHIGGASQYMWLVENEDLSYSYEYLRPYPVRDFTMRYLSGLQANTTYSVRVKAKVGEVWNDYGSVCTLTTPISIGKVTNFDDGGPDVGTYYSKELGYIEPVIYPNPLNGNDWYIQFGKNSGTKNIQIFNSVGQLMVSKMVNQQNTLVQMQTNLATGIYTVIISDNGNISTKKLVKE